MAASCTTVCAVNSLFIFLSVLAALLTTHPSNALSMPAEKNKILCVGIATLDTIATLDEFPAPDEKVRSKTLHNYGGGNAANTAVAISRLTDNPSFSDWGVDLLTAVGNDANGALILNELDAESVGVQHAEKYDGDSPWSYVLVAKDLQGKDTRTIIHQPASCELSVEHVATNIDLKEYRAVHFDARHPKAAVFLAKKCVEMGIPYSIDVERPREGLKELLQGASVVICNSNYCSLVLGADADDVGDSDMVKRFEKVLDMQAPNAKVGVMTIGSSGSFLLQPGQTYGLDQKLVLSTNVGDLPNVIEKQGALWCETISVDEVVDTTGAGDSFQGGFLSALWGFGQKGNIDLDEEKPFEKFALAHALRIGTRVAALKIKKTGAREGLPREDLHIEHEFLLMNKIWKIEC